MDLQELKNTITVQGQTRIWFTPAGWFFHEQPDSVVKSRDEVLACESIDELLTATEVQPVELQETENVKPAPKKSKKK